MDIIFLNFSVFDIINKYAGGEGDWRSYMTIPNILKEFNPKLVGYSLGPSLTTQRQSQFNVAEGGALSRDMPYMATVLYKRIVSDKRVNMETDWKVNYRKNFSNWKFYVIIFR